MSKLEAVRLFLAGQAHAATQLREHWLVIEKQAVG